MELSTVTGISVTRLGRYHDVETGTPAALQ
jgi:hypothetical protein